jgi:hypothetical protein
VALGGLLPTREGETTAEAMIVLVYHDTVRDSKEPITLSAYVHSREECLDAGKRRRSDSATLARVSTPDK